MDIQYNKNERYDEFEELSPNESFLYEGEVYTKIEACVCRKAKSSACGIEKNAIKLSDMSFHKFDSSCKVKLVKVKATVEDYIWI